MSTLDKGSGLTLVSATLSHCFPYTSQTVPPLVFHLQVLAVSRSEDQEKYNVSQMRTAYVFFFSHIEVS